VQRETSQIKAELLLQQIMADAV